MHLEEFRDHCLGKPGVTEEFPFDTNTLVFKVMGKMFALTGVDNFLSVNLKCDPEFAVELREKYESVTPGYHMNKKHWITVQIDHSVSDIELITWIDNSYQLVVQSLNRKLKSELKEMI